MVEPLFVQTLLCFSIKRDAMWATMATRKRSNRMRIEFIKYASMSTYSSIAYKFWAAGQISLPTTKDDIEILEKRLSDDVLKRKLSGPND
jgi:hypothetical protein